MTAKAEAIGHDVIDARFAGDVGNVVEVAAFAGVVEVDGGRKDAGVNGQCRGDQLDAAGGPQRVTELALGAGDLEPVGVGTENLLHAAVSARSPSAVLVPWALMYSTESAESRASSRQRFIERTAPRPSSSGAVMCEPSADMP